MSLLIVSFLAWVLTILAPCVLPLLPIILGASIEDSKDKYRPYIIILSLIFSIVIFSLLLKASTIFIWVDPIFWKLFSWVILIVFWILTIFPDLWKNFSTKIWFAWKSNQKLWESSQKKWYLWAVLVWISLWPVFSSCSPTYAIILAVILPVSFFVWLLNLFAYAFWLWVMLLGIALLGQKFVAKLKWASSPKSLFKKFLWILFLIVWLAIISGFDKKIETSLIDKWFVWLGSFEENLIEKIDIKEKETNWENNNKNNELSTITESLKNYEVKDRKANEFVWLWESFNIDKNPTLDSLKWKITLVNFWTFWCINCQNTIKDVKFLNEKYGSKLNILWIHSPEFSHEKDINNLKNFLNEKNITYPVIQDNNLETWKSYNNKYWPAFYLIDSDLNIRYFFKWENQKEKLDNAINLLLKEKNMETKELNNNKLEEAYFAWWCFWCMEWIFEAQKWVKEVITWYIGWDKQTANYSDVSTWETKHREWIKIIYDPSVISFDKLSELFWTQIDPTDPEWQFADKWFQYTTAMFYSNNEEKEILEKSKKTLQDSKKFDKEIATKILEKTDFFEAEEYHQDYYKKSSTNYKLYKKGSGREDFIEKNWENRIEELENNNQIKDINNKKLWYTDYSEEKVKNATQKNIILFFHADWCSSCKAFEAKVLSENIPEDILILKVDFDKNNELRQKYNILTQTSFVLIDKNWKLIKRWIWSRDISDIIEKIDELKQNAWEVSKSYTNEELKQKLTPLQYKVAVEWWTEPPFNNLYWDNHEEWIYVDVIDWTALFSSTDKFDSWTWWPSFTKPIDDNFIKEEDDYKLLSKRTEIKSNTSHLWHVFEDWPSESGWLRYCINSASLNFIPKNKLKWSEYEKYLALFK